MLITCYLCINITNVWKFHQFSDLSEMKAYMAIIQLFFSTNDTAVF